MRSYFSVQFFSLLLIFPILVVAQDIPNSQDHALISRYPGQTIRRFSVKEFDQYNLVLSVDKTGAPEKVRTLEGRVTRINYRNPAGRSTTEMFRNFEEGLRRSWLKFPKPAEHDQPLILVEQNRGKK